MRPEFSKQQKAIIAHRDGSLLVSAAAGSGKTTTLIAHVTDRLKDKEHPGSLSRMIIVTYTVSAAGEMRDKLIRSLEEALEEDPGNRHLKAQLAIAPQARIGTLDSFCGYLVRNHFQETRLGADYRIAEKGELELLKRETLSALLEEEYLTLPEDFKALLDGFGNEKSDKAIEEMILSLYDSAQNAPDPDRWLKEALPDYPDTAAEWLSSPFMVQQIAHMRQILHTVMEEQEALVRELTERSAAAHAGAIAALTAELGEMRTWEQLEDDGEWLAKLPSFKLLTMANKELKSDPDKELISVLRGDKDHPGYLEKLKEIKKFDSEEEYRLFSLTKLPSCGLVRLTLAFGERFRTACLKRNIADFMDVEHEALRLLVKEDEGTLRPSPLARLLSAQYDEIIVDEYQDVNQVQEMILLALSGEWEETAGRPPRLFMVGDVKQSIYGFRRAKPDIFMKKYASFSPYAAGEAHGRIDLMDNYRSRKAVLEASNALFSQVMSPAFGGVLYDEAARLHYRSRFEGEDPAVSLLVLEKDVPSAQLAREEARLLAARIRRLLEEDPELQFRDIVVLTATRANNPALLRALREAGIDAVAEEKKGFYDTREVQTMLSLLAVLDNPYQDVPMAAVLLSPFGGFDEAGLSRLRIAAGRNQNTLWENLIGLAEEGDPGSSAKLPEEDRIRLQRLIGQIGRWRAKAGVLPLSELIPYLARSTGYELYLRAMPGGAVRAANLTMLTEQAEAFEQSSYRGIYSFLRFLERERELEIDVGEAPLLSDGANVVRVGTMHSSKGLEYPVVFLAGLGRNFNEKDLGKPMLTHDGMGLALKSADADGYIRCSNIWYDAVRERVCRERRAEALRLLYVAMTRAKERLIMIGSVRDLSKIETGDGPLPLPPDKAALAKSMLDWFLMCRSAGDDLGLQWEIIRDSAEDLPRSRADAQAARPDPNESEQLRQKLTGQISFRYPYQAPPKQAYSVSELKRLAQEQEKEKTGRQENRKETGVILPEQKQGSLPGERLLKEETARLGGAERGTAYHRVMQYLPAEAFPDPAAQANFLQKAVQKGLLSQKEKASVRTEDITAVFRSEIGERIIRASQSGRLFRERPFLLGVRCRELDPSAESDEPVLLQGIIDLYFEEEGKLILIDYKTDRVRDGSELTERYALQLGWYRRALEAARDLPVSESYIYSFALRQFIPIL